MIGNKIGRLTVLWELPIKPERKLAYACLCECGKMTYMIGTRMRKGRSISCGCARKKPDAISHHPLYEAWQGMKQRCYNPNHHKFANYGGRGITVCERWKDSFQNFLHDMGERPVGTTLDRRENDGNYEPSNCRWLDHKGQANNRRKRGTMR